MNNNIFLCLEGFFKSLKRIFGTIIVLLLMIGFILRTTKEHYNINKSYH